jgi:hypothetical protein
VGTGPFPKSLVPFEFLGWLASSRSAARTATSWVPEESQVESCDQDNADIHDQPLPESISEEHEIYADYDGYHRHHVKHYGYLFAHFS